MPIIRGLDQLLADLDRRARPDARSRNRLVTKSASVYDTVGLSSDTMTSIVTTVPFQWVVGTSTGQELYWGLGEWS